MGRFTGKGVTKDITKGFPASSRFARDITGGLGARARNRAAGIFQDERFNEIGQSTIDFFGPTFGPSGDLSLSKVEGQELLVNGWYKQRGSRAIFAGDSASSSGSGGGGGRGRAGPKIPTFQELRDSISNFYENFVGTEATGAVEDHIYRKLIAGNSFESIEDEIQASSEFRARFPGIENAPQLTGPQYDDMIRPFDTHSLQNRGRVMSADEKRSLLAIKSEEQKQQWITSIVKDGQRSIFDVFSTQTRTEGVS